MKKGAIYGIIAAFIVIAMLIFLPVIAERGKTPAPVDTDAPDTVDKARTTDPATDPATTVFVTETDGDEETTTAQTTETETGTEEETDTTVAVTTTEEETTAEPVTTVTEAETTTAPVTTTEAETTTAAPVTTKPEETTKAVTTTKKVEPLDTTKKYVAFTFDDGPDSVRSKAITDKMLEYGGKCTFFVVGECIYGDREKGMKYAYEHGMEIGLHCLSHDHYYTKEPQYFEEEVYGGAEAIKKSLGVYPTIMRPPGGNITEEQYKNCEFATIIWNIDTNDWRYKKNTDENPKSKNIQTIVNNALYDKNGNFNVENGDIILMHEIYENSYDAFCIIIEELSNRGFEFVTVSELLQNPEPGHLYYSTRKIK